MLDAYSLQLRKRLMNAIGQVEELHEIEDGFEDEENQLRFIPEIAGLLKERFSLRECACTVMGIDDELTQWMIVVPIEKMDCSIAMIITDEGVECTICGLTNLDTYESMPLFYLSRKGKRMLEAVAIETGKVILEQPRYRLRITTGELAWDEAEWAKMVRQEIQEK